MSLVPLIIAVLVNFSMGSFYAWSVMVAPLEESLGATRSEISLAYSVSFITMTLGMFVSHSLLRVASLPYLLFVVFTIAGAGLAISGYFETLLSLVIGYGVLFGFGLGVSYFLALTAASLLLCLESAAVLLKGFGVPLSGVPCSWPHPTSASDHRHPGSISQ